MPFSSRQLTANSIQKKLEEYYKFYMNSKLNSYEKIMNDLSNICLTSNIQLFSLFNIIVKPRTFTNRFRKNNTLNNLIQLYKMIHDMLVNYDIQNTLDLTNYSCFYMLVYLFLNISNCEHLQEYIKHNGILIDLIEQIINNIFMLTYSFLMKIRLQYYNKYSLVEKNIDAAFKYLNSTQNNSLDDPQNFKLVNKDLKIKLTYASQLEVDYNRRLSNGTPIGKNFDYLIKLYIQFLSMHNICYMLNITTNPFYKEISKMFTEISIKNKLLFEKYIKYLGKSEVINTGFGQTTNSNALVKGLFRQKQLFLNLNSPTNFATVLS